MPTSAIYPFIGLDGSAPLKFNVPIFNLSMDAGVFDVVFVAEFPPFK